MLLIQNTGILYAKRPYALLPLLRQIKMWWFKYELSHTHAHAHNTHAHTHMHTYNCMWRNTISPGTYNLWGRPLSCCCIEIASNTDTTFSFPLALATAVSVFIRLWCMDHKISWLGEWASQWCPPQGLSEHKHYYNAATTVRLILHERSKHRRWDAS